MQAELDRFDADSATWSTAGGRNESPTTEIVDSPLGEFRIVWPDGSGGNPMAVVEPEPESEPASEPNAQVDVSEAVERALRVMQDSSSSRPVGEPKRGFGDFSGPAPSTGPSRETAGPSIASFPSPSTKAAKGPTRALVDELNNAVDANGFAPPTLDMRAELVYARAASRQSPVEAPPTDPTEETSPSDSVAQPSAADGITVDLRRGALRRLIDNLRDGD